MEMDLLLTVGSTRFDVLVDAVLSRIDNLPFVSCFLQVGSVPESALHGLRFGVQTINGRRIQVERYTDDLETRVAQARVVVGHAGAGTVLSFLRPLTKPAHDNRTLLLVPNDSLMDSHQSDLAEQMSKGGYAVVSTVERIAQDLEDHLVRSSTSRTEVATSTKVPPKVDIGPILDEMILAT